MTISFAQMVYGMYDREKFREEMEEEARVLRKDIDAFHPCDPAGLPSSDYASFTEIEDEMIARIDQARLMERRACGKMPHATPEQRKAHEATIARKRARRAARQGLHRVA